MQKFIYIVSTVLIILGVVLLGFSHIGFRYHVHETLLSLGPFQWGADADVTAPFSPIYGGSCIAVAIGLLIINRIMKK